MNKRLVSLLAVLCGFFILNASDTPESGASLGGSESSGERLSARVIDNVKKFAATTGNSLRDGAEVVRTQLGNIRDSFRREGEGPKKFWKYAEVLKGSAVEGAQGFSEAWWRLLLEVSSVPITGSGPHVPPSYVLDRIYHTIRLRDPQMSPSARVLFPRSHPEEYSKLYDEIKLQYTHLKQFEYGGLSALVAGGGAYAAERFLEQALGLDAKDYKRSTLGEATYGALLAAASQWAAQESREIAFWDGNILEKELKERATKEKAKRRKNFYYSMLLTASLFGGGDFISRLFSDAKKGEGPTTWSARLSSATKRFLTALFAMAGGSVLSHAANNEAGFSPIYQAYRDLSLPKSGVALGTGEATSSSAALGGA